MEANKETEVRPSASSPAKDDATKPVVSPENEGKTPTSGEVTTNEEEENEEVTTEQPAISGESKLDEGPVDVVDGSKRKDEILPDVEKEQCEAKNDSQEESKDEGKANKVPPPLPPRPVKRARTAYFIFMDEKRPQVQAQHQGEGVAAVAKDLGQMWGAMSPEEKKVYQEKAAKERERVSQELEAWKAAGGKLDIETKGGPKDPLALDFPVARIRKICKLDPEVRGLSKEGLVMVTKCAEMFLQKLGTESVRVAQLQNRRKLLPEDVAQVCSHREQFLFLKDDVKDLLKDMEATASDDKRTGAQKVDAARQAAAAGSKPLTSYFGAPKK